MEYDLVVIGSGSAAFAAGIEARSQGATVALVEAGVLGGICVNVGCVPSKTLLAAAEIAQRARSLRRLRSARRAEEIHRAGGPTASD